MLGNINESTRNKWIENQLRLIPNGRRILDAGAGLQPYRQFCKHLVYVSQDFCNYDGKGDGTGRQNDEWDYPETDLICDILSIPEPDKSFDVILCSEVLEHIPDPISALYEFNRLLKLKGKLILTTPFASLTHQSPNYFYTGFSSNFYKTWLPNYKVTIEYNGNYYEWLAQELHRTGITLKGFPQVYEYLESKQKEDLNSHLILCYGLMVTAIKVKNE